MARYSKGSQLETYEVLRRADDFSDSEDWP
jgi:hypothetical protein